jgi:oligopeptide transport system substrate-binding protein
MRANSGNFWFGPAIVLVFILGTLPVFGQAASRSFFSKEPILKVAFPELVVEWHPHKYYNAYEAQLYTAVYEGLVSNHPLTQRPIPAVAESWSISTDGLVYTFKLRRDARYSNGDLVHAKDFRDTWLALLERGAEAPFSSMLDPLRGVAQYRKNPTIGFSGIGLRVVDDHTLELSLERPASYFLQILGHQSLVPIHPDLLGQKRWDDKTLIIGNGPFLFKERGAKRLVFERNVHYWDRTEVVLHGIEIDFTDDESKTTALFNSHHYQWVLGNVNFNALNKSKSIVLTPQFSTNFLFFNQRHAAFKNPDVRTALGLLLDLKTLRSPEVYYIPAQRLVPEIPYYPNIKPFPSPNKTRAFELLEKAGYPKGKGLPALSIFLPEGNNSKRIADSIIASLTDLDIVISYDPYKGQDYHERLQGDKPVFDYSIASLGWIGDYGDPLAFLDLFASGSNLNTGRFESSEFDDLLRKAESLQGAARYKVLAQAEEYLIQTLACIPLSHNPAINVIDLEQVDGWHENPFDLHPFKYIKPKAAKPPRNIAQAHTPEYLNVIWKK